MALSQKEDYRLGDSCSKQAAEEIMRSFGHQFPLALVTEDVLFCP